MSVFFFAFFHLPSPQARRTPNGYVAAAYQSYWQITTSAVSTAVFTISSIFSASFSSDR